MKRRMVRRITLLVSVSLTALVAVPTQPAHADMPVIDVSAIKNMWTQIQQGLQQIQLLQSQLQEVMSVYNAISHITDLSSALSALSLLGIQNPLPVNISAVQSLLRGSGNVNGMLSSIGSLVNTNYGTSHIYDSTSSSFEKTLLGRNANSIAGVNGLAGQLYQSMADRLTAMKLLEAKLTSATDLKDVTSIQAEIARQQADVAAQGVQAESLAMMQVAYYQDQQQQREEQRQKDIDAVHNANPDKVNW